MPLDFEALSKRHKEFHAPQYIIWVDFEKIAPKDFPVLDVSVMMSAGYDMSTCEFTVAGIFDAKSSGFKPDVYTKFKPGRVVVVAMGYDKPVELFKGYINALNIDFNAEGGPFVHVQCLDAKGALVNNVTWKNYGEQDLEAVVTDMLKTQCSKYAKIGKVEVAFDKSDQGSQAKSPEIKDKLEDDYAYLKALAARTNSSFCVLGKELCFRKNLAFASDTKTSVELRWGRSLLNFNIDIDISEQVGKVTVYGEGVDPLDTFMAVCDDVPGTGESGSEMAAVAKNKNLIVTNGDVSNKEQAAALAKSILESHAEKLVKCKGSAIGIPEIKAGEKIKMAGMGKGIDGTYFLNHVTHRINGGGYVTSFDCSGMEVPV